MSARRLWAIAWKEWIHIRRDPRSLAVAVLLPVLLLIIIGAGMDFELRDLPFAVCDMDGSATSRQLRETLIHTELFRLVATVPNVEAGVELLQQGGCLFLLVLPPGLEADLTAGREVPIQVLLDGSDSNTASTARQYLTGALAHYSTRLQTGAQTRLVSTPIAARNPIAVTRKILYNPALESRQFTIPGLMVVVLVILSAILTSGAVVRERERGTFEALAASPLRPSEILLGKLLPYIVIGLLDVVITICTGALVFDVYVAGSVELLLACAVVFLVCALAVGLLISTIARTQQLAMVVAIVSTMLPSILLSGFVFPIRNMPFVLKAISSVIPATHFLVVARAVYLKGVGLAVIWRPLAVLTGIAAAILTVSIVRFRKQI
jgi:ABC-2 type transport system permease protein